MKYIIDTKKHIEIKQTKKMNLDIFSVNYDRFLIWFSLEMAKS